MRNLDAIKETKKSYIVDVDDYYNRERYYTGTRSGVILRFSKSIFPDLLEPYNDFYAIKLDAMLDRFFDRDPEDKINGIYIQRKGYIVE